MLPFMKLDSSFPTGVLNISAYITRWLLSSNFCKSKEKWENEKICTCKPWSRLTATGLTGWKHTDERVILMELHSISLPTEPLKEQNWEETHLLKMLLLLQICELPQALEGKLSSAFRTLGQKIDAVAFWGTLCVMDQFLQ